MNVICGAGTNGRNFLGIWKGCGLKVECFVDNNSELWGKEIQGTYVKSFEEVTEFPKNTSFYITIKSSVNAVREQLLSLGILEEQIKDGSMIVKMFGHAMRQPEFNVPIVSVDHLFKNDVEKILFDLQNGLVLGGVESWSLQTSRKLKEKGWEAGFLLNGSSAETAEKDAGDWSKEDLVSVRFQNNMSEYERIVCLSRRIAEAGCRNIIVNFVGYNLAAACLAKRIYPDKIRVIAVVHNDEDVYYEFYKLFENYIDRFLFISERIRDRMLYSGFQENKLEYLPWEIVCEEKLARTYTVFGDSLRIGYAGRIELQQKRLDHVITIAKELKQKRIDFKLELAGSGSYEEELKKLIKENSLEDVVQLVGCLKPADINGFWKEQDIMVSCSDWEGHSISQGEAMANGVVPIVTDVSGVRDDITDGQNGFIVEVGVVEQIVERISYLYEHRELLPIMGEKAHKTIFINNNSKKLERLWRDMLLD